MAVPRRLSLKPRETRAQHLDPAALSTVANAFDSGVAGMSHASGVAAVLEHAALMCFHRFGAAPLRFELHPDHLRDLIREVGSDTLIQPGLIGIAFQGVPILSDGRYLAARYLAPDGTTIVEI